MLIGYATVVIIVLKLSINTYGIKTNISGKIVNGFPCHPADYPYLISLKSSTRSIYCGGSLLNRFHVLTAGHCCNYRTIHEQMLVVAGLTHKRSYIQHSKVWQRFIHPSMDLCVVRLFWAIEQNPYIKFVKLATPDMFDELMKTNSCDKSITMGFGYQRPVEPNTKEVPPINQVPTLQCVEQKVLQSCPVNIEATFCVIGANYPNEDACFGDSGGPLICKGIQIGLVSSGIGCALGIPSRYVNVADAYDYIKRSSGSNKFRIKIVDVSLILLFICFT